MSIPAAHWAAKRHRDESINAGAALVDD